MPNPKSEEDKKHGDKLGSLIGQTGGASSPQSRDDDAEDDDPTLLQDDDDEDVQNDDAENDRDVGER